MAIQHVNRRGDTYYLHQAKTKTGKPKWFLSTKQEGDLADSIPKGYEIYENPNSQVFLRKKAPRLITAEEVAAVEKALRAFAIAKHAIVDAKKDAIVVHLPHEDSESLIEDLRPLVGGATTLPSAFKVERYLHYTPMMRFVLRDKERRLFSVERWCFRGGIDDWYFLAGAADLSKQVKKYIPHLGKESFFELM
jgi:hypothetical protein